MPYFHATHRHRMPSILAHGLGWRGAEPNWPGIERGVYLAEAPEHAIFVMLDWYCQVGHDEQAPRDFIENMAVIVIDDSRVPRHMLGPDPDIHREGIWLYRGIIDVRGMPVIGAEMALVPPRPCEP